MIRLYLETNFLMSYATGRDPAAHQLLKHCPADIQRVIPGGCLMEALATLEDRQKQYNGLIPVYRKEANEAKRNRGLASSAELEAHLQGVIVHAAVAFDSFGNRLLEAMAICAESDSSVKLLPVLSSRFVSGFRSHPALDPTDQLILASILDDARSHPDTTKVFLTENRRCFFDDALVWESLREAGVRKYFASVANFLKWYEAGAEF